MPIEIRNDVAPTQVGNLALATGQGIYAQRQQELANQQRLQYAQLAQQDMQDQRRIAASQQAMQYQHMAGLQDRMMGAGIQDYFGQQQYGRQQAQQQAMFGNQADMAKLQSQLGQENYREQLNAQGKQRQAEIDRERTALDDYWRGINAGKTPTPEIQRRMDYSYAQQGANAAGIKDPRYLNPDPLPMADWIKNSVVVDDANGFIAWEEADGSRKIMKDANHLTDKQVAGRQKTVEIQAELERDKFNSELKWRQQDAEDKRRENHVRAIMDASKDPDTKEPTKSYADAYKEADALIQESRKYNRKTPEIFRGLPGVATSLPVEQDGALASIYDTEMALSTGKPWADLDQEERAYAAEYIQQTPGLKERLPQRTPVQTQLTAKEPLPPLHQILRNADAALAASQTPGLKKLLPAVQDAANDTSHGNKGPTALHKQVADAVQSPPPPVGQAAPKQADGFDYKEFMSRANEFDAQAAKLQEKAKSDQTWNGMMGNSRKMSQEAAGLQAEAQRVRQYATVELVKRVSAGDPSAIRHAMEEAPLIKSEEEYNRLKATGKLPLFFLKPGDTKLYRGD